MRRTKAIEGCLPYTVIRDQQEKAGHGWKFRKSKYCAGTDIAHLPTGDYTVVGFDHLVIIERKGSAVEFVGNLSVGRRAFDNEMARMRAFPYAFVFLEFAAADLVDWPRSARISRAVVRRLPLQTEGAALAAFTDIQLDNPHVHFQFVGDRGQPTATSLFKRVIERHAHEIKGR